MAGLHPCTGCNGYVYGDRSYCTDCAFREVRRILKEVTPEERKRILDMLKEDWLYAKND